MNSTIGYNTKKVHYINNRKQRILNLIKTGKIDIYTLAKILKSRPQNVIQSIKRKKEINSLKLVLAIHKAVNKEISLHWIITGKPPFKGYQSTSTINFKKHICNILDEHSLAITDFANITGLNRTHLHRVFNQPEDKLKINHIIFISMLTGLNFDYILDGTGPKYYWDKNNDNFINNILEEII